MTQQFSQDESWFRTKLHRRLVQYCSIGTTSDPNSSETPSSKVQWKLLELLRDELQSMGADYVRLTEKGYLIARIDVPSSDQYLGFCAHVDTAPDYFGLEVHPQSHENYDGSAIVLKDQQVLDPQIFPDLLRYKGDTIVTSDGTSLLGGDDKAGIAEIMTAFEYFIAHKTEGAVGLELVFTPDEEIGRGTLHFPYDLIKAKSYYTLDGLYEGVYNDECFYAASADITISGVSIHPGLARGKLVNALTVMGQFIAALPQAESPEATDEKHGFYATKKAEGSMARAQLGIFLRDFDKQGIERRKLVIQSIAQNLELRYPGAVIEVKLADQYQNLKPVLDRHPHLVENLKNAIEKTGMTPVKEAIRGGTDGAMMTANGVPTPNIFAGEFNMHGPLEWVPVSAMVRACHTVLNLVRDW